MKHFYVTIALFFAAATFQGCSLSSLLGGKPGTPTRLYTLSTRACTQSHTNPQFQKSLIVDTTRGASLIDRATIAFTRAPGEWGFYQFATWAALPTEMFTSSLLANLDCSGLFRQVSRGYGLTNADFFLATEIVSFFHDATVFPEVAVVIVRADLVPTENRDRSVTTVFRSTVPLSASNSGAAVAALNEGVDNVMVQMLSWIESSVAAKH